LIRFDWNKTRDLIEELVHDIKWITKIKKEGRKRVCIWYTHVRVSAELLLFGCACSNLQSLKVVVLDTVGFVLSGGHPKLTSGLEGMSVWLRRQFLLLPFLFPFSSLEREGPFFLIYKSSHFSFNSLEN
jgi:hypothetical protein